MKRNAYGDILFELDGGLTREFSPHSVIEDFELERVHVLGRHTPPAVTSCLVLKNPNASFGGNIRDYQTPAQVTPSITTDKPKKATVKRAVLVTKAAKDFGVTRPTINKWERGEGNPPENFTLSDPKVYLLCLKTYETTRRFNSHITETLKTGKTFTGRQMSKPRLITRGDMGQGREADYQTPDPMDN